MIFVWGSYAKERVKGRVADRCPICRDVRPFRVVDHVKVSHLYWIPLGRGTVVSTSKACAACGASVPWHAVAHPEVCREGEELSMQDLVRRTNPVLGEILRAERSAEAALAEAAGADDPEAGWTAARDAAALGVARLRAAGREVEALVARMRRWHELSDDDRQGLLDDVLEAETASARTAAAVSFVAMTARTAPEHSGCLVGFLLWVAIGPIATMLLIRLLPGVWIMVLWLVAVIPALVLSTRIQSGRVRRWVVREVIPKGVEWKVDFAVFLDVLARLRRGGSAVDAKLGRVITERGVIARELLEKKLIFRTDRAMAGGPPGIVGGPRDET